MVLSGGYSNENFMAKIRWLFRYFCPECDSEIVIIVDWGMVCEYHCTKCNRVFYHKEDMKLVLEKVEVKDDKA